MSSSNSKSTPVNKNVNKNNNGDVLMPPPSTPRIGTNITSQLTQELVTGVSLAMINKELPKFADLFGGNNKHSSFIVQKLVALDDKDCPVNVSDQQVRKLPSTYRYYYKMSKDDKEVIHSFWNDIHFEVKESLVNQLNHEFFFKQNVINSNELVLDSVAAASTPTPVTAKTVAISAGKSKEHKTHSQNVTKHESVRLLHLRKHPQAQEYWTRTMTPMDRQTQDAVHSNASIDKALNYNPWVKLAEIFNNYDQNSLTNDFQPENLTYIRPEQTSNKVNWTNYQLRSEQISRKMLELFYDIDPCMKCCDRDWEWIKKHWKSMIGPMSLCWTRFTNTGKQEGCFESKEGREQWIFNFAATQSIAIRYSILVLTKDDWTQLGREISPEEGGRESSIINSASSVSSTLDDDFEQIPKKKKAKYTGDSERNMYRLKAIAREKEEKDLLTDFQKKELKLKEKMEMKKLEQERELKVMELKSRERMDLLKLLLTEDSAVAVKLIMNVVNESAPVTTMNSASVYTQDTSSDDESI